MLPRHHRLRNPRDFAAVLRARSGGRRRGSPHLVVHCRLSGQPQPPRAGLAVSRAVGNSVTRNLVSRRLRALLADRIALLPQGCDLVIRATPAAATASMGELAQDLDAALSGLGLTPSRDDLARGGSDSEPVL